MRVPGKVNLSGVVEALRTLEPERIILFGSCARGDSDEISDLDIVVIMETEKRFLDRLKDVYRAVRPTFAMDALVYTKREFERMLADENPFAEMIASEGKIVYERPPG